MPRPPWLDGAAAPRTTRREPGSRPGRAGSADAERSWAMSRTAGQPDLGRVLREAALYLDVDPIARLQTGESRYEDGRRDDRLGVELSDQVARSDARRRGRAAGNHRGDQRAADRGVRQLDSQPCLA